MAKIPSLSSKFETSSIEIDFFLYRMGTVLKLIQAVVFTVEIKRKNFQN